MTKRKTDYPRLEAYRLGRVLREKGAETVHSTDRRYAIHHTFGYYWVTKAKQRLVAMKWASQLLFTSALKAQREGNYKAAKLFLTSSRWARLQAAEAK